MQEIETQKEGMRRGRERERQVGENELKQTERVHREKREGVSIT